MFSTIFAIILYLPSIIASFNDNLKVSYLETGNNIDYVPVPRGIGFYDSDLRIYCYQGSDKSLARFFQTVELQLDIDGEDFTHYEGPNPEIVKAHHDDQQSIFILDLFSTKKTKIQLDPFNQTCIGIETLHPYKLRLHLVRLNLWRATIFILGIFTFWSSANLSKNPIFYYISGILLGICASMLVLIYLLGKLIPRRPLMYGVVLGGWTIVLYIVQKLIENIQVILVTYRSFIVWYIVITGTLSFIICYRFGPPKNPRSKNLIKWGLQAASLAMIYYSSQYEEASIAVVVLIFIAYYIPTSWIRKFGKSYYRWFPPKPRLLTSEEFYEQGIKETTKALDELRDYCSSPECKQWRVMMKLKDPLKFASFIEGSPHVSETEVTEYENSRAEYSDSDISEEEDDQVITPDQEEDISEDEEDEIEQNYSRSRLHKAPLTQNNGRIYSKGVIRSTRRNYRREYSDDE